MKCRKRKKCRFYHGDHCNMDLQCRAKKYRYFEHIKTDLFYVLENKFNRNKITFSDRLWKHIDKILTRLHLNPYP